VAKVKRGNKRRRSQKVSEGVKVCEVDGGICNHCSCNYWGGIAAGNRV
jgi:hypothetical protein